MPFVDHRLALQSLRWTLACLVPVALLIWSDAQAGVLRLAPMVREDQLPPLSCNDCSPNRFLKAFERLIGHPPASTP